MPPKRTASSSASENSRKATSSIEQNFKPAAKKSASVQQAAKQQSVSRSNSLTKITQPALSVAASSALSRDTSPEKRLQESSAKLSNAEEVQKLPLLNVEDIQWDGIWKQTQREKLGEVGPSEYIACAT